MPGSRWCPSAARRSLASPLVEDRNASPSAPCRASRPEARPPCTTQSGWPPTSSRATPDSRRSIVVLSDGRDTVSSVHAERRPPKRSSSRRPSRRHRTGRQGRRPRHPRARWRRPAAAGWPRPTTPPHWPASTTASPPPWPTSTRSRGGRHRTAPPRSSCACDQDGVVAQGEATVDLRPSSASTGTSTSNSRRRTCHVDAGRRGRLRRRRPVAVRPRRRSRRASAGAARRGWDRPVRASRTPAP